MRKINCINILNVNNGCKPLPNTRVDIGHCDKDGYYYGYTKNEYLGDHISLTATIKLRCILLNLLVGRWSTIFFKIIKVITGGASCRRIRR